MTENLNGLTATSFRSRSGKAKHNNNLALNRLDDLKWMYEMQFIELSANRFVWELPKEIDKRFVELELFYRSLVVVFKDEKVDKFKALRGSGIGQLDWYDNPTDFTVVGNLYGVNTIPATECVPIWGNYMRYPDIRKALIFANQLAEIDRTIEINIAALRYTKLVSAKENGRLSMANIMKQVQEGQPVVYTTKGMEPSDLSVLDLGVDHEVLTSLMVARTRIWDNAMTMLGINNANQDKKERLVSGEPEANDQQIEANRNIALNAREQACDAMNEMFPGINASVKFKADIEAVQPDIDLDSATEESKENVNVHDDA